MIFTKFNEFSSLNENVQNAKKLLRDLKLASVKEETKGDENVKLTPEQIREAENNPAFLKIKKMVERNPGYTEVFVRFHFLENVPLDEVETLYNNVIANKDIINGLPKQVDKYLIAEERNGSVRTAFEDLTDDIERLGSSRKVKKVVDEFPSELKRDVLRISGKMKERFEEAAIGLFDLDESLKRDFFKKVSALKTVDELIRRIEAYVKAANNDGFTKVFSKVNEVNAKFGEKWGAEIVYVNEDIQRVIIELRSYDACNALCSHTSWCIANSTYHWNSYVGGETKFTKQYAIFDYSVMPTNPDSAIGATLEVNNKFSTAHRKNDNYVDEATVRRRLTKEENAVLVGMTSEEKEAKVKYVKASKELSKDKLPTIEVIKKCLEDGAYINIEEGKPLRNAVKSNSVEIAEFLLANGANPNITFEKNKTAVSLVKTFDMLKLLLKNGANMNKEAFKSLSGDFDAVKYIIEEYGVDPNFEDGYAIRAACRLGNMELVKYLNSKGIDINSRDGMPLKFAAENLHLELVKWLIEVGANKGHKQAIKWASLGLDDSTKPEDVKRIKEIVKILTDNLNNAVD